MTIVRTMLLRSGRAVLTRCVPTARNVHGPFYRSGAPLRERLADSDEPGEPLVVFGTVAGLPDCRPLGGALLDVWQTNARGLYSNMLGLGDPADSGTFRLRGKFRTGSDGAYRLETIMPGRYPLGPLARPRHIHLIVTHPGFEMLITQMFFEGDSHIRWDPWAKPELVIRLDHEVDVRGRPWRSGRFDVVLSRAQD